MVPGIDPPVVDQETFPLGDSAGITRIDDCSYPNITNGSASDAYTPHVAEGIGLEARNEFLDESCGLRQVDQHHPQAGPGEGPEGGEPLRKFGDGSHTVGLEHPARRLAEDGQASDRAGLPQHERLLLAGRLPRQHDHLE